MEIYCLSDAVDKCRVFTDFPEIQYICHNVFNSAHLLTERVSELDENIKDFMSFFRTNWPEVKITPKLHMVEDFMVSKVGGGGVHS